MDLPLQWKPLHSALPLPLLPTLSLIPLRFIILRGGGPDPNLRGHLSRTPLDPALQLSRFCILRSGLCLCYLRSDEYRCAIESVSPRTRSAAGIGGYHEISSDSAGAGSSIGETLTTESME